MNRLHVLNGDATAYKFKASGIEEDFLVWREALSEGPVCPFQSEEAFWNLRAAFIHRSYGENRAVYEKKVISEFARLKEAARYDEITLWFEHDLFCQVNLLFC